METLVILIFLLLPFCLLLVQKRALVTRVVDGDTLKVITAAGVQLTIRIKGIDAPEIDQKYGDAATLALEELCLGKMIDLTDFKKDCYGSRTCTSLYIGKVNIGEFMVNKGHAYAYMSKVRMKKLERVAKAKRLGVHAMKIVKPSEWRKGKR